MNEMLNRAKAILLADPQLSELVVREEGGELHLLRGDDRFARLIPAGEKDLWRMAYCQNRERWECLEFRGTLRECLAFLAENPHFQFWEG